MPNHIIAQQSAIKHVCIILAIYCHTCHIWCWKWIFKTQHFLFCSNRLSFPQQWLWNRCRIVLAVQDLHWLANTAHFYLEPLDKTLHGLLMLSFHEIWMGTFYRTCCLCISTKCDYLIWKGQHGAFLGPTGPRWAPCWPHVLCFLGLHPIVSMTLFYINTHFRE